MNSPLVLGDYVGLVRGKTYKGSLVGAPGPALLGLGSILPGGGFRHDFKTYGGDCPSELMLEPGDSYVSLKGATKDGEMIGSVARLPQSVPAGRLTQDTVRLVFRERNPAIERYIYWLLQTPDYRAYCAGRATGSAVVALSRSDFLAYPVPALTESRNRIVTVLEHFEDKIESNRRLVDLSMALVNAEFSKRFGERALALELGAVADVVDCLHSKKPERVASGPTLIQLKNIRDDGLIDHTDRFCISEPDYAKWAKKFETRAWDCVITNVGRIGAVARVPEGFAAALGRNMTGIRPRSESTDGAFIAASLVSAPLRREIELKTDSGTIMDALNVRSIPGLRLPQSTDRERVEFHSWASPSFRRADQLLSEIQALAVLRDALLPELLCGRIRARSTAAVVQHGVTKVRVPDGVPDSALRTERLPEVDHEREDPVA